MSASTRSTSKVSRCKLAPKTLVTARVPTTEYATRARTSGGEIVHSTPQNASMFSTFESSMSSSDTVDFAKSDTSSVSRWSGLSTPPSDSPSL